MEEIRCPKCGSKMYGRKCKRAAYSAPRLYLCSNPACGTELIEYHDALEELDQTKRSDKK